MKGEVPEYLVSVTVPKTLYNTMQEAFLAVHTQTGIIPLRNLERLRSYYFYMTDINHFDIYKSETKNGFQYVYGFFNGAKPLQ